MSHDGGSRRWVALHPPYMADPRSASLFSFPCFAWERDIYCLPSQKRCTTTALRKSVPPPVRFPVRRTCQSDGSLGALSLSEGGTNLKSGVLLQQPSLLVISNRPRMQRCGEIFQHVRLGQLFKSHMKRFEVTEVLKKLFGDHICDVVGHV